MASSAIEVQIACDDPGIPPEADIHGWVEATLRLAGPSSQRAVEVTIRIVDTDEIRALNNRYREQDKATNVLSFPAGEIDGLPDGAGHPLGDVIVCAPVVAEEAGEQGKPLADHWGHMLVHGMLHLLGFDHDTDSRAAEMEGLEIEILAVGNVTDPYARS